MTFHIRTIWDLWIAFALAGGICLLPGITISLYDRYVWLPRKYPHLFGRK